MGDYDHDGRLDILLTGDTGSNLIAQVWRNTGSGFTNINAGLPGVRASAVAWGDYDNDGRLDILLTGADSGSNLVAQLWHNTGTGFAYVPVPGLPGVSSGSVAWGDYDNDGLLDILLTGTPDGGLTSICQVWRNTGGGFTDISAGLPGVSSGKAVWGDSSGDGLLDVLLAGSGRAQVWRSHHPKVDAAPSAPSGLATASTPPTITLSWNTANDGETPANALTYNLRIGTVPSGGQIFNPSADSVTGVSRLAQPGNMGHRLAFSLSTNLPPGFYYWSVQAVDGAFEGSAFAAEGYFAFGGVSSITNMVLLPNGSLRLDILGTTGKAYQGFTTSDLGLAPGNWTGLGAATEVSPGYFQLFDPGVAGHPRRLYKVRTP